MMIAVRFGAALAAGATLAGCTSLKSYVHPLYQRAVYADLDRPAQPLPVHVRATFLRNGQRAPEVDASVAAEVRRVVTASGAFVVSEDPAVTTTLDISANNLANGWAAKEAGFFTAMRLGVNGQMVDDDYQFVCLFTDRSGNTSRSTYRHEIHTSAGDLKRFTDQPAMSPQAAFGQVVEDVVVTCIKHLQEADVSR